MRDTTKTFLAAAHVSGQPGRLERLLGEAERHEVDALALVGNLAGEATGPDIYRRLFRILGEANLPAFYVPGSADAPIQYYLREAYNVRTVFPQVRGVHGTVAFAPGYVAVAGIGGEIVDDEEVAREEIERIRYPGWEAEHRLSVLDDMKDYRSVHLYSTPPAGGGTGETGSEVVAELVKTHAPRVTFAPFEKPHTGMIGTTRLVQPGSLTDGHYAVVDIDDQEVEFGRLEGARG